MTEQKPRLFLGRIADDFRPGIDIASGPWVFIGAEGQVADWEKPYLDGTHPPVGALATPEDRLTVYRDLDHLIRYFVGVWADRLNARHGTDFGRGFWWTLLIRWLVAMVGASYRRKLVLDSLMATYAERSLDLVLSDRPADENWDFADTQAVVNRGLLQADFDLWLWTRLARPVLPGNWTPVTQTIPPPEWQPPAVIGQTNAIKRLGRKLLRNLRFSDVPGFRPWECLMLSAFLAVLPAKKQGPVFRGTTPEAPPKGLAQGFVETLDDLLAATLPRTLNEDFSELGRSIEADWFKAGKLRVTAQATTNDPGNRLLAHAIEAGEQVVRVQHGSGYGLHPGMSMNNLPEFNNRAFFSWGWTREDAPKLVYPLPMPGFSRASPPAPSDRRGGKLILIGTKTWIRPWRLDHVPEPDQGIQYRAEKAAFVEALSPEARSRLLYRAYERGQSDLADRTDFAKKCPDVDFADGDLTHHLHRAALVILDHPGTTLNGNLALDIPTICFWDPETWPLTRLGSEVFGAFSEVGMLHSSGRAAALFINEHGGEIEAWWQHPETRAVVEEVRGLLGWGSAAWRRKWIKTLVGL
ncbi:MAG: hypothetical protein ACPGOV_15925 [Magnetovibrionaceae bacterium]